MKTKYYQYNKTGGEKYSEFTEEEYLVARTDENRWFISFGNCVLECMEAEYRAYFSEKNHADYTQRDKNGKTVIPLSLEQYSHNTCEGLIFRDFEEEVLKKIMAEEMLERLHTALKKLNPYERNIIHKLFWENKNQTQLADEYCITQQTMHEKITRVLAKLLKLQKNYRQSVPLPTAQSVVTDCQESMVTHDLRNGIAKIPTAQNLSTESLTICSEV